MIVDKNSWHCYLLKTYGKGRHIELHYPDSCSYISGVVKTSFAVAAITIFSSIIAALTIGQVFSWIAACIVMQTWIMADCGVWVTGGLVALTLISIAFDQLKSAYNDRRRHRQDSRDFNKTPGFFSQAYDTVHNKFCTRIEVVG